MMMREGSWLLRGRVVIVNVLTSGRVLDMPLITVRRGMQDQSQCL
jgi:hypothetical protein